MYVEGRSRREAARRFGIDPRTVVKMLAYIFRDPEISSATAAPDDESTGAAWVMSSQAL